MSSVEQQLGSSAYKRKPINSLYYVGRSMFPILRNLDILSISSAEKGEIKRGDIIVFRSIGSERMIAHRVISIENDGVKTRGDNMYADDLALVLYNSIIGKVTYINRESVRIIVHGGFSGLIMHYMIRCWKRMQFLKKLYLFMRPFADVVLKSPPARKIFNENEDVKAYIYKHPKGSVMRLFLGKRFIGRSTINTNTWKIDPRFRHIVDIDSLPAADTIAVNDKSADTREIEGVE